jgi:hypothetical protein
MTNGMRQGRSHEGVPDGDLMIVEVTVRLYPGPGAGDRSFPPRGWSPSGTAIFPEGDSRHSLMLARAE